MIQALQIGALVLAAANLLVLAVLAIRRASLARAETRAQQAQDRMREIALALVDGEPVELGGLGDDDARGLAALLARYGRLLTGTARRLLRMPLRLRSKSISGRSPSRGFCSSPR